MGKLLKKCITLMLAVSMFMTSTVSAASNELVKFKYNSPSGNYTAEKLSHPNSGPGQADGLINFDNGDPDTGQNYSWTSVAYGEYMYIGTCYAAMYNTMRHMAYELGMDLKEFKAIVNVLYNGTLYVGDEKNNPDAQNRAVIIKLNTKTLEVSIVEPPASIGGYRASIEFKDKLYFSAAGSTPYLLEVDPKTDTTKVVYKSQKPTNPSISTGIRGLTVVGDSLIASMIGNNGAYIVASTEPSKGESSFKTIATQQDMLDYPAYKYTDSIFGGSVWDMVSFNDKLYFTVVTGKDGNKSPFAMFVGEQDNKGDWSIRLLIGKEEDNPKYPIGLGASRSGAANLQVYDGHLYIGGYNDPMIALADVLNFKFESIYKDLSNPVNLWRMDSNENIELVAGEPNELFPKVVGNQTSGFGTNLNQYVWDMETYEGKLYVGTFNIGSLAYPIMQFANGDVLHMTKEELQSQIKYIKELIEIIKNKQQVQTIDNEESLEDQINDEEVLKEEDSIENKEVLIEEVVEDEEVSTEEILDENNLESAVTIEDTNKETTEEESTIEELSKLSDNLELISEQLDSTYESSLNNRSKSSQEEMLKLLEDTYKIYEENKETLPLELKENLSKLLNKETIQNFSYFVETCKYLSKGQRGFSLLVSSDGKNFETITNDGFGDPYNHGLRTFSKTTTGLCVGTANPFNGTQVWRIVDNKRGKVQDSTVDKTELTYDKYKKENVEFKIEYNGNTLDSVQKDYKDLTEGKDYIKKDKSIIFTSEYLDKLELGSHDFRLRFSNNGFIDVKIKVVDSTPGDTTNPGGITNPSDTTNPGGTTNPGDTTNPGNTTNLGNTNNNGSQNSSSSVKTGDNNIMLYSVAGLVAAGVLFLARRKFK